jgi:hypothetical protein
MPPACPPSIPANLHQTLSLVRSQVFQTVYNPTGARIGTKYIRKALKGPRITNYYLEPTPSPKKFNTLLKETEKRLEEKWVSRGGDKREAERWRLDEQIAPGYVEVMNKPEAWGVEGPMWDPREEYRKSKIEFRKSIGKGRPAKGESCAADAVWIDLLMRRRGEADTGPGQEEVEIRRHGKPSYYIGVPDRPTGRYHATSYTTPDPEVQTSLPCTVQGKAFKRPSPVKRSGPSWTAMTLVLPRNNCVIPYCFQVGV